VSPGELSAGYTCTAFTQGGPESETTLFDCSHVKKPQLTCIILTLTKEFANI